MGSNLLGKLSIRSNGFTGLESSAVFICAPISLKTNPVWRLRLETSRGPAVPIRQVEARSTPTMENRLPIRQNEWTTDDHELMFFTSTCTNMRWCKENRCSISERYLSFMIVRLKPYVCTLRSGRQTGQFSGLTPTIALQYRFRVLWLGMRVSGILLWISWNAQVAFPTVQTRFVYHAPNFTGKMQLRKDWATLDNNSARSLRQATE